MTASTASAARRRCAATAATVLAAAALALAAPAAASAHVHVTPSDTAAGATAELAFSFSHGCDGSPTTAVELAMPDEIASVALIANPGWQVASEVVDGARTVVLTADRPVPDGVRETLEVEVALPDAPDGTVLAFPALQVCEAGETLWGDLDPAADTPAPTLTIGDAGGAHGHGDAPAGADAAGDEAGHGDTDAHAAGAGGSGDAAARADEAGSSPAMATAVAALAIAVVAAALAGFSLLRRRTA